MPKKQKTYPKSNSKSQRKNKLKETHDRAQQKPVSIFKSKYYWISLTATILVFTFALGYIMQMSKEKELLMLGSVLSVIGLAFYIGYKPSENYDKRATFFFVGASIHWLWHLGFNGAFSQYIWGFNTNFKCDRRKPLCQYKPNNPLSFRSIHR